MKASHSSLFHQVLKNLKREKISQKKLLVAVSGGVDSTVLLDLLYETSKILKLQISVAHVHHGIQSSHYRNQSQIFVHFLCEALKIPFFTNTPRKNSNTSETQMRQFRYKYLHRWMKEYDYLILAHTADDLLETRLSRMIRGTGKEGLTSMEFIKEKKIRPLIYTTKDEILHYAQFRKLEWMEDPSNKNPETIRNWIRKKWIPQLEKKRTGSIQNLSKSLERISEALSISQFPIHNKELLRQQILQKSLFEQKQEVASYMKRQNMSNYTHRHIEELLKHIRSNKKRVQFKMLNQKWMITPTRIYIQN